MGRASDESRFSSRLVVEAESMATAHSAARNLCAAATPHDGAQNICTRTTSPGAYEGYILGGTEVWGEGEVRERARR